MGSSYLVGQTTRLDTAPENHAYLTPKYQIVFQNNLHHSSKENQQIKDAHT